MRRVVSIVATALLFCGIYACTPYRTDGATVIPLPSRAAATAIPTPEPTPTPTAEASPTPTPSPTPDAATCDTFYHDTVFVGDSLTVGFSRYVSRLRREEGECLDGAAFLAAEGVSVRGLRYDNVPESGLCMEYDGEKVSVSDGIRRSGKSNVVILLGTNDFGGLHPDGFLAHYTRLLDRIEQRCADVSAITLMAVPPVSETFCTKKGFSIEQWNSVNDVIRTLCSDRGYTYLSFAEALGDQDGYLDAMFSIDGKLHLNDNGFRIWLEVLRAHAMEQMCGSEANDG